MMIWEQAGILLCTGVLLLLSAIICIGVVRRKKSKQKVSQMEMSRKIELLNELSEPFGFFYDEREDVFSSYRDAWQRKNGYTELFDKAAASANMIIDAWPVYFDYAGKTWLVEFWKGQYGINTGGEVGIYRTEEPVSPYFYPVAHFEAAEDDEMPIICCRLERKGKKVYEYCERHWWLTGFRMGTFSKPSDLRLLATLNFEEPQMAQALFEGLRRSGEPRSKYRICGREVCVQMDFSKKQAPLIGLHRFFVQLINRFYCRCYLILTKPFTNTAERMVFLYYLLPGCFRRMLRLASGHYQMR
ncbi:MAG: DUF4474 domain-containing protein [Clostridiales bacterium]|nr:DUF4474 domain-containing protein [Roseburia sp.]MDD7637964.1 DUF4474 domain-containing protein [Clostridiales bacterium]MDY4112039.1 DUF4474 domain-containing protein [Roseburia sp.]